MSRWSYYAPLCLGCLLAAIVLAEAYKHDEFVPRVRMTLLGAAAAGLALQLLFIGAQGAAARVLPVPGGRSIRGGAAVLAGSMIIVSLVLLAAALMTYLSGFETPALVTGVASAACALTALGTYLWSLPAAARDF
ncbi:MAG: hypothetical protein CHACPFDD_01895 [Phycisphaerae bacterium]|nr:hypothetical protein [Phycisphaerae bacterium]